MTSDVQIDKISEIKLSFSTYQNRVGLPSNFRKELDQSNTDRT